LAEPPSHLTPVGDAEKAFVDRIAAHVEGAAPTAPTLIGEGYGNWVYRVERAGGPVALKLGKPHRSTVTI
jgi:hypothetical protein